MQATAAPKSPVEKEVLLLIPKECLQSHSSKYSLKKHKQKSISSHNGKNEDLNLTQKDGRTDLFWYSVDKDRRVEHEQRHQQQLLPQSKGSQKNAEESIFI